MNFFARWVNFSIALFFCISANSFADDFHYNSILIGDRASGMGGAYTAISDDASGLFYNPAGIVYVTDKNFSASVNTFSFQRKRYENAIGGQTFERKSSGFSVNYFGFVKPIGNLKIGFSYAVPDAVNEDLSQFVPGVQSTVPGLTYDYTFNLNNRDVTYNIGPSIAAAINSDLSVGLTLYLHQRDILVIQNKFTARSDLVNDWSNSYYKQSETGLKPIFGVTWSPVEKLSLGVALSTVFLLDSSTTLQESCVNTITPTNCDNNASPSFPFKVPTLTNYNEKRKYPIRLALGAAYFANSNLLLSTDVTYHTGVTDPVYGDKVATLDAAIGTEYYLSRKWAMRAGFFTNVANTPPIVAGVTQIEEHINVYGGSLSFTRFTGDSSVTLGGSLNYGVGLSQFGGISPTDVQNASTFGWSMFLSSSY